MKADRIKANWEQIRGEVDEAARRAGREPTSVAIVAVTKRHPAEWILPLIDAGATSFGENYPQELWEKAEALADRPGLDWHLIGHLQSNKVRRTLPLVRFVHAVDSPRLLAALDTWVRGHPGQRLEACLQINISGESSKHGWAGNDLEGLCRVLTPNLAGSSRLAVTGLMTIAGYGTTNDEARPMFASLRALRDEIQIRTGHPLPHLSMGMSGDFAAAVAEGSTLVRIGSALFEGADEP